MHIYIKRFAHGNDSTGGLLFINRDFECYTVEDQQREGEKVYGETAIPQGNYEVELRAVGGFHNRYQGRYGPDFHKGMLHVRDVPNFKYILFHSGNNHEHTEGCILIGDSIKTEDGESTIPPGRTRGAYKQFYKQVRDAIINGEHVLLHIDQMRV